VLLVHTVNVHTCCTQALPSTVDTHEHPVLPPAHAWLHPVAVPAQVSAQVGTQKDRACTHAPAPLQNVPGGQHVPPPLESGQQEEPEAQHTAVVAN
jgi:hypothetical protein